MSLTVINIALPTQTGLGPIVDVSSVPGSKTVIIPSTISGNYILLGSHDDTHFSPVASFQGPGTQSAKQIIAHTLKSVRFRAAGTCPPGTTTSISGTSAPGVGLFVSLPTIPTGSIGPQDPLDLYTLASSSFIDGANIIVSGYFTGAIAIEGSSDGISYNTLATFQSAGLSDQFGGVYPTGTDFNPVAFQDQIRYLRANVTKGTAIVDTLTVTAGGSTATQEIWPIGYFGVKGDGSDETSLIQNAFNVAAQKGVRLLVTPGNYGVSGTIAISASPASTFSISGDNSERVKFTKLGNDTGPVISFQSPTISIARFFFSNFSIVGNGLCVGLSMRLVAHFDCQNLNISNCTTAFQSLGCVSFSLRRCELNGNQVGFSADRGNVSSDYTNLVRLTSCIFSGNTQYAAHLIRGQGISFNSCEFGGNTEAVHVASTYADETDFSSVSMTDCWWESNSSYAVKLDLSTKQVRLALRGGQIYDGGDVQIDGPTVVTVEDLFSNKAFNFTNIVGQVLIRNSLFFTHTIAALRYALENLQSQAGTITYSVSQLTFPNLTGVGTRPIAVDEDGNVVLA